VTDEDVTYFRMKLCAALGLTEDDLDQYGPWPEDNQHVFPPEDMSEIYELYEKELEAALRDLRSKGLI